MPQFLPNKPQEKIHKLKGNGIMLIYSDLVWGSEYVAET